MIDAAALCVGIVVGVLGTIVGAGGGFLLIPLLIVAEPSWSTETVTAFSLAVVAANASAGAFSYWRQGRVDLLTFPIFALAATPGAILGALTTHYIPRHAFDLGFGVVLIVVAGWLLFRPQSREHTQSRETRHTLVDREGTRYEWRFNLLLGIVASAAVGFLSSTLGIGGGIIHVPFMIAVLGFPEHVATATSHAVLAVTTIVGALVHVVHGDYKGIWQLTLLTTAGAMIGAPIGAHLSRRLSGIAITRILAVALGSVAVRLIIER